MGTSIGGQVVIVAIINETKRKRLGALVMRCHGHVRSSEVRGLPPWFAIGVGIPVAGRYAPPHSESVRIPAPFGSIKNTLPGRNSFQTFSTIQYKGAYRRLEKGIALKTALDSSRPLSYIRFQIWIEGHVVWRVG